MSRPKRNVKRKRDDAVSDPLGIIGGLADSFARSHKVQDSPLVSKLLGNLRSRSFGSAVLLADSLTSQSYGEPTEHFVMNQLASFVRKVPFQDPTLKPEASAWEKFLQAEATCRETNQRLFAERTSGERQYSHLRELARAYIRSVIGYKPNLKRIYERCDFGPGASSGIHGNKTHLAAKLSAPKWTCTPTASAYARSAMMGDHHIWEYLSEREIFCLDPEVFKTSFDRKLSITAANKIVMVPKTAKVHRTIAVEPLLNGYVQKGVDVYMRACLHRHGINLRDQTVNQLLAQEGSKGGPNPLCTIDLSAASDSLSIETARDLLPPDWFTFLNNIRSPMYESKWGNGRYEKFTSMGNGFCFPLETLIFASIVHAAYEVSMDCVPQPGWTLPRKRNVPQVDWHVYGDDIIVRQRSALLVLELLDFYGFKANTDKTFLFGPFRESCGADYFDGVNVRPYTLDFIPDTYRDLFKIANGLFDTKFHLSYDAWNYVVAKIPERYRYLRPYEGPPDTAIQAPLDICMSSKHVQWNRDIDNWVWREYVTRSVADSTGFKAPVEMYGLLRGSRALRNGSVEFAIRHTTRTSTRWVPCAPSGAKALKTTLPKARYFL